MIKDWN